jgi:hypothetical protein
MVVSHWIFFRMRNVSSKICREKNKTYILCSITFFHEIRKLLDNLEKYRTARQTIDDNIIQSMCSACWITKDTDIHLEYVILLTFAQPTCHNVIYIYTLYVLLLYVFTPIPKTVATTTVQLQVNIMLYYLVSNFETSNIWSQI